MYVSTKTHTSHAFCSGRRIRFFGRRFRAHAATKSLNVKTMSGRPWTMLSMLTSAKHESLLKKLEKSAKLNGHDGIIKFFDPLTKKSLLRRTWPHRRHPSQAILECLAKNLSKSPARCRATCADETTVSVGRQWAASPEPRPRSTDSQNRCVGSCQVFWVPIRGFEQQQMRRHHLARLTAR